MTSLHHPMDLQYGAFGRYPGNAATTTPRGARPALQINLDVSRTRRTEFLGR